MKIWKKKTKRIWLSILFSLVMIYLLIWSLSQISWQESINLIGSFDMVEITFLILLNIFIFSLFTVRWSIILETMGFKLPFSRMFVYRLIGFGISYFTPGPQFGGEPAQIILLSKNQKIPSENALTSVYLDRLVDVLVNFTILAFGLVILVSNPVIKSNNYINNWFWIVFFILIPPVYLLILYLGNDPVSRILKIIFGRLNYINTKKILEIIKKSEIQIGQFIHDFPQAFIKVIAVSIFSWILMIFEYWLMLNFMGISIDGLSLISALTAARVAFLTPLPGGIGALEAGQIWVMQIIGISTSVGISAAIYIRIRDSALGIVGLLLASKLIYSRDSLQEAKL